MNRKHGSASAVGELLFAAWNAHTANTSQAAIAHFQQLEAVQKTHSPEILAAVAEINLANASQPIISVCGVKGRTVHEVATQVANLIYRAAANAIPLPGQWSYPDTAHAGSAGWEEVIPERWEAVKAALAAIPEFDWQHCYAQARKERDRLIVKHASEPRARTTQVDANAEARAIAAVIADPELTTIKEVADRIQVTPPALSKKKSPRFYAFFKAHKDMRAGGANIHRGIANADGSFEAMADEIDADEDF